MKLSTPIIPTDLSNAVDKDSVLFWFRRDLRLEDNAGLYYALKENPQVIPLFIFDTVILDALEDKADKRVAFIHQSLTQLQEQVTAAGSSLLIGYGNPVELFNNLHPKALYCNTDYEPYALQRDANVTEILTRKGIPVNAYKDHVIFEKNEILKENKQPYTVFTPYSKKWKSTLTAFHLKRYPTGKYIGNLKKTIPSPIPPLEAIGFTQTEAHFPSSYVNIRRIELYDKQRDFPALQGTSRLSVHIRFGTVSIRHLARIAQQKNTTWLNELIWRDFYAMILWHFPAVREKAFKPAYDQIPWRNDPHEFQLWCDGKTGYPMVDAGMRELNTTGFMHNRVRMIVASFLVKHLLIDWRWGEAYFAAKLLDYDLASNNGGWQWAAGSGCDAVPYFRVFNPQLQQEKFDPKKEYIKQWVPEYDTPAYPAPVVIHTYARERALKIYKRALAL